LLNLVAACPGNDWTRARALVTHPRIAQMAQRCGFGTVMPTKPAVSDVLQTLESLHGDADS